MKSLLNLSLHSLPEAVCCIVQMDLTELAHAWQTHLQSHCTGWTVNFGKQTACCCDGPQHTEELENLATTATELATTPTWAATSRMV